MFRKYWLDLNYKYAMSNRYLAAQRGDVMQAIEWERKAWDWLQQIRSMA